MGINYMDPLVLFDLKITEKLRSESSELSSLWTKHDMFSRGRLYKLDYYHLSKNKEIVLLLLLSKVRKREDFSLVPLNLKSVSPNHFYTLNSIDRIVFILRLLTNSPKTTCQEAQENVV